jgi:high affinity Mn2+ porin
MPPPHSIPSAAALVSARRARLLASIFAAALAAILLPAAGAQTLASLPSAPEPQLEVAAQTPSRWILVAGALSPAVPQHGEVSANEQNQRENIPVLTMAPHPEGARYWISGQANVIFQGRLPFHSPYQGPNSFRNSAEYKTSMLGTLYMAVRPWRSIRYQNDLILDVESTAGRGLSEALGLAGFTNLDVVRNPYLGSAPYLARYEVHQVIGLSRETVPQDSGPFSVASRLPVRRIEVRIGKISLPDFFDVNPVGSDSHLQFMNWTVDDDGAWDYAADTRGYTGIFAMPVVANGLDLDWAFSRAHGNNTEFEWRHSLVRDRAGMTRVLFYDNRAHMGNYRTAVEDFLNGSDTARYGATQPAITLHEKFNALKYGGELNSFQEITGNLRVFARVGWDDGATESFAYTEDDQTVETGFDYRGTRWRRPADKIGVAVVSNAIKKDHQNYLMHGGLGFLLGDGALSYGRENIVESYYNWHAWKGLYYAADVQHIGDPGYNRARGPAWVGSVRGHIDF